MSIRSVGVAVKRGSEQGYAIARELLIYGKELGLDMLVDEEVVEDVNWSNTFRLGIDPVDVIVVIGGNGTLCRTLHKLGDMVIPIMTVRMGRRGFLLDVPPSEARDRLRDLVEGRYTVVDYMRLRVTIESRESALPLALNDVVVQSWGPSKTKVVRMDVYVDEDMLYSVDGDGVIVSTPLGSSAYALAAGGPLVDTDLESLIVVPLAPLQFNAKPVVLSPKRVVRIHVAMESGPVACVVDGQSIELLKPGDTVKVYKAEKPAKIIRFARVNTYARLRYTL